MRYTKATVGLFTLNCACGANARVIDVLERTNVGRETVRYYCQKCGCISWWYRTLGPEEKVMLIDREERPSGTAEWPPRGWMHRHCPPRRAK